MGILGPINLLEDGETDTQCSYTTGLRTLIIMVAVGIVFAALQIVIYVVHNKRLAEGKHTNEGRHGTYYIRPVDI